MGEGERVGVATAVFVGVEVREGVREGVLVADEPAARVIVREKLIDLDLDCVGMEEGDAGATPGA